MTSIPASRRARAMIFAPRSCPSRPGLATTTRILRPDSAAWFRSEASTCVRPVPYGAGSSMCRSWVWELSVRALGAPGLTAAGERPMGEQRGDHDDHDDHGEQTEQRDDIEPDAPAGVVDPVHLVLVNDDLPVPALVGEELLRRLDRGLLRGGVCERLRIVLSDDVPAVDLVSNNDHVRHVCPIPRA